MKKQEETLTKKKRNDLEEVEKGKFEGEKIKCIGTQKVPRKKIF